MNDSYCLRDAVHWISIWGLGVSGCMELMALSPPPRCKSRFPLRKARNYFG